MKYLIFSIILATGLVLLSHCSDEAKATPTPQNMTCELVNGTNFDIQRCENNEALCLITSQGSISCKWK